MQHRRLSTQVLHPAHKAPGLGRQPASKIPLPCCAVQGEDGHMKRGENPARPRGAWPPSFASEEGRLSLQDSHEEMQFPKGTTMAAAEPRLVLDDAADVFQLLVAQPAFMEPFLSGDVHSNRRWCSKDVRDQWQESLENEFQGGAASLHVTFIFTLE